MYNGYKVEVFVFAGRKENLEILLPQIKSDTIDKITIGVNTKNEDDLKYIHDVAKERNFNLLKLPSSIKDNGAAFQFFFKYMTNSDTIYFKIDDDVVYLEPNFFEKMLEFRFKHKEYICIYPFIVNNQLTNHLMRLPFVHRSKFKNEREYIEFCWKEPKFAEALHHLFLLAYKGDIPMDIFRCNDVEFGAEKHFGGIARAAINVICFYGNDAKILGFGECPAWSAGGGDEEYLTHLVFKKTKRKHCMLGNVLAVHYAFGTQVKHLNEHGILKEYKNENFGSW